MATPNETEETCIFHELLHEIIEPPHWVRVAFTTFTYTTFVVGVGGNLLTCIVIYCNKKMHTATNYYLFNLAVCDCIAAVGMLMDVNVTVSYPVELGTYFTNTACRVHIVLIIALWNNSILVITALAIERYIAIWHPLLLNTRFFWRRVLKIIYLIWAIAILQALPEIWTVHVIKTKTSVTCFIVPTKFARILNGILALTNYVIPLAIIIFVYTMVAIKMNSSQKSNSRDKIFNRSNCNKVNKLIIALTLSFAGCWLPFFMMRVFIASADWCRPPWFIKHWDLMMMISSLSWFSTVLNPIIFSMVSTKFRKALKELWNTKVRRQNSNPITQA